MDSGHMLLGRGGDTEELVTCMPPVRAAGSSAEWRARRGGC